MQLKKMSSQLCWNLMEYCIRLKKKINLDKEIKYQEYRFI